METKTKKQVYTDKQYKLTKDKAPLTFMLPTKNSTRNPLLRFDDEKGENRELRYARNQNSPFVDEQDGNAILEPIVFEDGFLTVSKNNQVLQKFLHTYLLDVLWGQLIKLVLASTSELHENQRNYLVFF